jgi:hypothetical protein
MEAGAFSNELNSGWLGVVDCPRFSSLELSRDEGGPFMYRRAALRQMCVHDGFDPVAAVSTMERDRACIIRLYLQRRIHGDERDVLAEEIIAQAAADPGLLDGSQLPR